MTPLFKKLNLTVQRSIVVLNAPADFEAETSRLAGVDIRREVGDGATTGFGLAFAITRSERDAASAALAAAAEGDAILWIAYPKATSKRYACEFNRDAGWDVLAAAGFEAVRQVAIDEDWSALRFRRVQFIRALARAPERAATAEGKARLVGSVSPRAAKPLPR